jgi:hypothetical protein
VQDLGLVIKAETFQQVGTLMWGRSYDAIFVLATDQRSR